MKLPWVSRRLYEIQRITARGLHEMWVQQIRLRENAVREMDRYRADAIEMQGKMVALDDAVDHWRDAYKREHEQATHWEKEARRYASNADYWRSRVEAFKESYPILAKEFEGEETKKANIAFDVRDTGALEVGRLKPGAVLEVRSVPEVGIAVCDAVDTGKLVQEAAPGGAAPGRGR